MSFLSKKISRFKRKRVFIIFSLAVVCVFVGYLIARGQWDKKDGESNQSSSSSLITPSATVKADVTDGAENERKQTSGSSIKIPELGIQIINLPNEIADLNYAINVNGFDTEERISGEISTTALSEKDKQCSPTGHVAAVASLLKVSGVHSADSVPVEFIKQFDGYWIGYQHPQSTCSNDDSVEKLHMSQMGVFEKTIKNPNNIHEL